MYEPLPQLSSCAFIFDFDNTLTAFDVLDDFISRFAVNDRWTSAERKWRRGRIGSRECLEEQLKCLRVTRKQAEKYLEAIRIDPYFPKIVALLGASGVKPVVVSDSFYFFIDRILKNSGITGLRIFSNQVRFQRDRVIPIFSDQGRICFSCANCKKRYLLVHARQGRPVVYVGDGLSDLCAARQANLVYAKAELARALRKAGKPFIPFKTISDVYLDLMKRTTDEKTKDRKEETSAV
ncbi:MAG: MtnX-like HAD-IB family phosphatase [Deltaproteobacteria bacterium]